MFNRCIKCGEEAKFGLTCYQCDKKEAKKEKIIIGVVLLIFLGPVIISHLVWAKVIYKDMRCAWAQCRIQVNP